MICQILQQQRPQSRSGTPTQRPAQEETCKRGSIQEKNNCLCSAGELYTYRVPGISCRIHKTNEEDTKCVHQPPCPTAGLSTRRYTLAARQEASCEDHQLASRTRDTSNERHLKENLARSVPLQEQRAGKGISPIPGNGFPPISEEEKASAVQRDLPALRRPARLRRCKSPAPQRESFHVQLRKQKE